MKLSDAITKIYKTHWSYTNNFRLIFTWENATMTDFLGWNKKNDMSLNIVSFQLPSFSTDEIQNFIADRWILEDGTPSLYNFTITIRDQDALKYYRTFLLAKLAQQKLYFNDYKFSITFTKLADYIKEGDVDMFKFEDCMIKDIGGITFSNEEEARIAQFDLNINCAKPLFNTADT